MYSVVIDERRTFLVYSLSAMALSTTQTSMSLNFSTLHAFWVPLIWLARASKTLAEPSDSSGLSPQDLLRTGFKADFVRPL